MLIIANGIYVVNGKSKYKEIVPLGFMVLDEDGTTYLDFMVQREDGSGNYDAYMVESA